MDLEIKRAWQKELRNPANAQCRSQLICAGKPGADPSFCCLGLLQTKVLGRKIVKGIRGYLGVRGTRHDLFIEGGQRYIETSGMTESSLKQAGMTEGQVDHAIEMNDQAHLSFPQIADAIEDW
jgi:hypothetical protein